ncbi:glycerate kinase [Flagellimonas sp. DF-77]|uniref:glycerate kinase n=1 Tax=Flagellimonas algarum TaxID=3230298 RepID=UPI00339120DC
MKFVIAPDKFKGSLSGAGFCSAVEKGIRKVFPEARIIAMPMADGGDGSIDVLGQLQGFENEVLEVNDPLFRPILSRYLIHTRQRTAFVELSEASGHKLLVSNELDCLKSSSYGTGELIRHAIEKGARHIIVGLGGSATNDGGMGIAAALGFRFYDRNRLELEPIGKNLIKVAQIEIDKEDHQRIRGVQFKLACDVGNPFNGPFGAAFTYAPQKGANDEQVGFLDDGLRHFAEVLRTQFELDVNGIKGAGAAGGVAGGLAAMFNASLCSGFELMADLIGFEDRLQGADWIITGEGKIDAQTQAGKTIQGIAQRAIEHQVPVAAFCGNVALDHIQQQALGLAFVASVLRKPCSLVEAMHQADRDLEFTAFNFASLLWAQMKSL